MRTFIAHIAHIALIALIALIASFTGALPLSARAAPLGPEETARLLVVLDDRQRNSGDYQAVAYIESKQQDKDDLLYELVVYRRDDDDKLMMLLLKPKSEAGKGYLRIDKNLFMYDPATGKWDRRTEREHIAGTDSNRADYDESRLAEDFMARYVGEETLGKFAVHHVALSAKPGVEVAYPTMHIWVDQATGNLLKAQESAASGRLMRTTYYPRWDKLFSPSKGADVYFPREIRIYDEVQKGNRTTIAIQTVDLAALPPNMFTKAWLESKSR